MFKNLETAPRSIRNHLDVSLGNGLDAAMESEGPARVQPFVDKVAARRLHPDTPVRTSVLPVIGSAMQHQQNKASKNYKSDVKNIGDGHSILTRHVVDQHTQLLEDDRIERIERNCVPPCGSHCDRDALREEEDRE